MKKTISIILVAAVILLAYTPKTQAGDDGWAALARIFRKKSIVDMLNC